MTARRKAEIITSRSRRTLRVAELDLGSYNQTLIELSKLRGEVTKIPTLEQRVKGMIAAQQMHQKEKEELMSLVSSLRDQINDMEDEKTNALNDESLMREKLKFVVKEKDILNQKIRNLEGMYQSELGEVKHAEDVMQQLKKANMELEYLRKNDANMKREKEELKMILQGLKEHVNEVELQREHFEDHYEQAQTELDRVNERHKSLMDLHQQQEYANDGAGEEIEVMRARLDGALREKESLERENMDLQDRLEDNINKLYEIESKRNSVNDESHQIRPDFDTVGDAVSHDIPHFLWSDLQNILRDKWDLEIPEDIE